MCESVHTAQHALGTITSESVVATAPSAVPEPIASNEREGAQASSTTSTGNEPDVLLGAVPYAAEHESSYSPGRALRTSNIKNLRLASGVATYVIKAD